MTTAVHGLVWTTMPTSAPRRENSTLEVAVNRRSPGIADDRRVSRGGGALDDVLRGAWRRASALMNERPFPDLHEPGLERRLPDPWSPAAERQSRPARGRTLHRRCSRSGRVTPRIDTPGRRRYNPPAFPN
jgi:hypothetical protein